jgi:hypothetical protein
MSPEPVENNGTSKHRARALEMNSIGDVVPSGNVHTQPSSESNDMPEPSIKKLPPTTTSNGTAPFTTVNVGFITKRLASSSTYKGSVVDHTASANETVAAVGKIKRPFPTPRRKGTFAVVGYAGVAHVAYNVPVIRASIGPMVPK